MCIHVLQIHNKLMHKLLTYMKSYIIIIIIIKVCSTGPSVKNKIVDKLLTPPHKHMRHGNPEKETKGKETND